MKFTPTHHSLLRCGDMIYWEGELAEVERVRGRYFVSNAEGYSKAPDRPELDGCAEVTIRQWEDGKWSTESFVFSGGAAVVPCKHVIIPAGKYKFRNAETGEESEAEMAYSVGYQWEVLI